MTIRLVREYSENTEAATIKCKNEQRQISFDIIIPIEIIEKDDELMSFLQKHDKEEVKEKARNFYYFVKEKHAEHTGKPIILQTPAPAIIADIPDIIDGYHINNKAARKFLSAININRNILLVGPTGCGKTELAEKLAKHTGNKFMQLNLHSETDTERLIGKPLIENANMTYQYAMLPQAMKSGSWLLLDEIDHAQPEHLSALQAVFEGRDLVVDDNGGEIIKPHEKFRLIATANTLGRGDTGGYYGTNQLNISMLDRWAIIKMNYTEKEPEIIKTIVDNNISKKIMLFTERVRNAISLNQIPDYALSTRLLINWAKAITDKTLSFQDATEREITDRLTVEEFSIINEFINDIFADELGRI
jgi:cobaltochelatase CobS